MAKKPRFKWVVEFEAYDAEDAREVLYNDVGGILRSLHDALKATTDGRVLASTLTDESGRRHSS